MDLEDLHIKIPPYIRKMQKDNQECQEKTRFRRLSEKMELEDFPENVPPYIQNKSDERRAIVSRISKGKSEKELEKEARVG